MSGSKIKSLVIAALALINVFFLVIFIWGRADTALAARRALENIRQIMLESGVTLQSGAVHGGAALKALRTGRDAAGEEAIARACLGDVSAEDQGGGILRYTSALGSATFNSRGEFVIEYTAPVADRENLASAARRWLRTRDMEATAPIAAETVGMQAVSAVIGAETDGTQTVSAVYTYKKTLIFNCRVTFELTDGGRLRVTGRRPAGIREGGTGAIADVSTVLMGFLSSIRAGEVSCRAITDVRAGYHFNAGALGDGELSPGWRVTTDAGEYFVNSLTGELEAMYN
ncbi:MAG: hypothetical protein LBT12_04360 [Oscillospiraceae bacterium]|jgi:hypothetical protein|nr:hypothetical protein [Oscillospiraceae bacterium]